MEDSSKIKSEGLCFARYLSGRTPSDAILERYADGVAKLGLGPGDGREAGLLGFAARNAWAVPMLDAATGFLRPRSVLRKRLLLMSAILETTTEHADLYLPQVRGWFSLAALLGAKGAVSLLKAAAGALLLPLAERSRA